MIAQVEKKIAAAGVDNVATMLLDIGRADKLPGNHEGVLMQMALHHVADVEKVLRLSLDALSAGGSLFIADLVAEDGSFHASEPSFSGHNGFDPAELATVALRAGFSRAEHSIVYEVMKESEGRLRAYPVFLLEVLK